MGTAAALVRRRGGEQRPERESPARQWHTERGSPFPGCVKGNGPEGVREVKVPSPALAGNVSLDGEG